MDSFQGGRFGLGIKMDADEGVQNEPDIESLHSLMK
jgi:hypothetical protein